MSRDVLFWLDTKGGQVILHDMVRGVIDDTAKEVAGKARLRAGNAGASVGMSITGGISEPNKLGETRYLAMVNLDLTGDKHKDYEAKRALRAALESMKKKR